MWQNKGYKRLRWPCRDRWDYNSFFRVYLPKMCNSFQISVFVCDNTQTHKRNLTDGSGDFSEAEAAQRDVLFLPSGGTLTLFWLWQLSFYINVVVFLLQLQLIKACFHRLSLLIPHQKQEQKGSRDKQKNRVNHIVTAFVCSRSFKVCCPLASFV